MVTSGQRFFKVKGDTVAEAFHNLFESFPQLRIHILDESDSIRQHILVYADDSDIRWTEGLSTPITDCQELTVIQAVSGG